MLHIDKLISVQALEHDSIKRVKVSDAPCITAELGHPSVNRKFFSLTGDPFDNFFLLTTC